MSRIDDNNKLIKKVEEQLDALLDDIGALRAEGDRGNITDTKYADLLSRGERIFHRMDNMDTLGNLGHLEEIINTYDSAIGVITKELEDIRAGKDENGYTDKDVKGLEDLVRIAKESKEGSRSSHEMAAVKEYSSRQKENELFAMDAIMKLDEKIDKETIYIRSVKAPIESLNNELVKEGAEKYNDASKTNDLIPRINSKELELSNFMAAKRGEGLTEDQIKQDAEYIRLEEAIINLKNQFIEKSVGLFDACKNVNHEEGRDLDECYDEMRVKFDTAYSDLEARLEQVLSKNKDKLMHIVQIAVGPDGKQTKTIQNKRLENLIAGCSSLKEKLAMISSEKAKIADNLMSRKSKILDYQKEKGKYQEENTALVPAKHSRFSERMKFLREHDDKGRIRAFFGALRRKKVEKKMANNRTSSRKEKADYYKEFHKSFAEELRNGADYRDAKSAAKGKVYENRFEQYKKEHQEDRDDR